MRLDILKTGHIKFDTNLLLVMYAVLSVTCVIFSMM